MKKNGSTLTHYNITKNLKLLEIRYKLVTIHRFRIAREILYLINPANSEIQQIINPNQVINTS